MDEFSCSIQCKSTYNDSSEQPFKATFLWERIISHLERTVKIGWHCIALRWYNNCFHGSKAVDCLKAYLTTILPRPVKRAQAVILCGKLQETDVIQCVKKKTEFREKGLYRFTHSHFWKAPSIRSDSDEPSLQNGLAKSRSVECLEPPSPVQRLKGYASDSTVTVSTHKRKKIRTRKISHRSADSAVTQKKPSDLIKGRKLSPSRLYRPDNTKPDSQLKLHSIRPKLIQERWSQVRDKEYHRSRPNRERRCSKQVKPSPRDWQALAELPPSILDTRTISRSHSFSSGGELLGLSQQNKPTNRHSSGKWTIYGFI